MFALVGFAGVFELDGDEDELEVGEEGLVEPVVAGGGLAVVLHAVEDAFDHVPSLVRLPVVVPWGRAVPLGRHDRRQAERLGQQAGGPPSCARSMSRCAPMNAPGAAMERLPWRAGGPSRPWSPWRAPEPRRR